ncbi:MAG: MarR family transcriptional regulator [Planctomycetota bacterium]
MNDERSAERFVTLFHQIFLQFHHRDPPGTYLPSPETVAFLEHLSKAGPLTVGEAAIHFRRSQSTISEIVARLEGRELVERFPDERDRRRSLVWLTPTGLDALGRAQRILSVRRIERAWATWDEARRSDLLTRLEQLLEAADSIPQEEMNDDDPM